MKTKPSGHYLMITLPAPFETVERVYFPLLAPEETVEQALERYVAGHPDMKDRVRNRDKTERRIRGEIIAARTTHPTSWRRQQAEDAGLPWPVPTGRARRRAR
jgi:hypothetical protein